MMFPDLDGLIGSILSANMWWYELEGYLIFLMNCLRSLYHSLSRM